MLGIDRLCAGADVISEQLLREKLQSGKRLVIKLGVDPTRPDIHLGHVVVLRKMRMFQEMGHEVVFLIGDFTARIGDPTGRSETRPVLSPAQIQANAETYVQQVGKVLDRDRLRVAYNSEWLSRLNFADVLGLCGQITVARMLEREDFAKRYEAEQAIHVSEFLYPLMQGYDSVALEADVEMGGLDQRFNILLARNLQRSFGQPPQVAFLLPILPGLDGVQKMSKSLDNYVGVDEAPDAMVGKLMSLPDDQIPTYLRLLTEISEPEIVELEREMQAGRMNPRDAKLQLAEEIAAQFHGRDSARGARQNFLRTFSQGVVPESMPEYTIGSAETLVAALQAAGVVASTSEARRLLEQGAVEVSGVKVRDVKALAVPGVVRVGKHRFVRFIETAKNS